MRSDLGTCPGAAGSATCLGVRVCRAASGPKEDNRTGSFVSAHQPKALDAAQGLLIALAAVLLGIALVLGDVTLPRSVFGGSLFVLAGVCWAMATLLKARRERRRA